MKEIPYFRYNYLYSEFKNELDRTFSETLGKGAILGQQELKDFERTVADFLGVKYAIGVGNGTSSLLLMTRVLGVQKGDEVIIPSHTFVATAAAVAWWGATPVLVDCGNDHLLDVDKVEAAITPKTKAIIIAQLNGRTGEMDRLQAIADKHHLVVLEDAAQAFGSKFLNRCAGTWGIMGSFSFHPAKTLGAFGDGGMIVTQDEQLAHKLFCLRDHGRDPQTNEVVAWGINSRLDNVQAAMLLVKFSHYSKTIQRRRTIMQRYCDRLAGVSEITMPPAPNTNDGRHYDIAQNCEIEAEKRDELRNFLKENGIGTLLPWGGRALHQIPALQSSMHFDRHALARTELLFKRCLMLPLNTSVTDDEVDYVCDTILKFYR